MEMTDAELIAAVLKGDRSQFEVLIQKYLPRVFATVRRHARQQGEVEDIVQEIWVKSYQKLASYRAEAPFEHWLMSLTVRTCYDFLRKHQRNREMTFTDLSGDEQDWLERFWVAPDAADENAAAARALLARVLDRMSPASRLIITLLEIEERSVKEIAQLTGWSVAGVKVRAFRARLEMRKHLEKIGKGKYL